MNVTNYTITIGRRMGSGGLTVARMLGQRLGITVYDKELLLMAARQAGLCPEFFERNDERRPHYLSGLFSFSMGMSQYGFYDGGSAISDDHLYNAQCRFIREVAAQGPCVIVGRTADYVLRQNPNTVNVFITAGHDDCAARLVERGMAKNTAQAREMARRTNRLRAEFYNFYTDKKWGDPESYDLCLNSSRLGLEGCARVIERYLQLRLDK